MKSNNGDLPRATVINNQQGLNSSVSSLKQSMDSPGRGYRQLQTILLLPGS